MTRALLLIEYTHKSLVGIDGKEGASSSNHSATWNAYSMSIFCDVYIKEVEAEHRPGSDFNKEGYSNIIANFKAETGHDYEKVQLK